MSNDRPHATDDYSLVAAWRAGDENAARVLFERYFDRLYRFFATKIDHGVEDLIQETLLACVEGQDSLREARAFPTFVFGVARRRLYRKWRGENRGANAIDFGLTSVIDLATTVSRVAAEREEHRLVLEAMRRLPVDLQIALELFYWEGMPASEIGRVLDVPEGTVRSRLRRGRRRVSEELGPTFDDVETLTKDAASAIAPAPRSA